MTRGVALGLAMAAGGCLATPSPAELDARVDDAPAPDRCARGFEPGDFDDTVVDDGTDRLILLDDAPQGFYTSPIADAGEVREWTLSWTPALASLRPLPAGAGADVGYPSNLDMAGNVALYHLDEPTGNTTIEDHSGNALDVGCSTTFCPTLRQQALFVRGGQFGTDRRLFRGGAPLLEPAQVTIEVWARKVGTHGTGTLGSTGVLVAKGYQSGGGALTSYALEQVEDTGTEPTRSLRCYLGHASGGVTATGSEQPDLLGSFHAVCTFDGEQIRVYVDGDLDGSQAMSQPIDYALANGTTEMTIGTYGVNNQDFNGVIDEVAIYDRALDATEVRLRWLRGALRVLVQVRSCDDPGCDGEEFVGPDGGPGTYFTEQCWDQPGPPRDLATRDLDCDGDALPDDLETTAVPPGRYAQFRIRLETADPDASPEVIDAALCPVE